MKPICQLLCCILLIGCTSGEQQSPETQIQQATLEASPEEKNAAAPDVSQKHLTPLEAVHDYFDGICTANVKQAKAALVMNDRVEEYLLASIDNIRAIDGFAEVDNEKFGGCRNEFRTTQPLG